MAGTVAHQSAGFRKSFPFVTRWDAVADRQCGKLIGPADEEAIRSDKKRADLQLNEAREYLFKIAFATRGQHMNWLTERTSCPLRVPRAGFGTGFPGFINTAKTVAFGTSSRSSSNRLAITAELSVATPVRLPPGRFKLGTRPADRSSPMKKTTGIVAVAAFVATAAAAPTAAITPARRAISSAAKAGSRSYRSLAHQESNGCVLAFGEASVLETQAEGRVHIPSGVRAIAQQADHQHRRLLRVGGERPCERRSTGSAMNSRRLM